jgi:hypothetical protein
VFLANGSNRSATTIVLAQRKYFEVGENFYFTRTHYQTSVQDQESPEALFP